ncbi:WD40 repeat-like protein [Cutaneotrichosporon oleaginosum]|uniref:WD40 repeat-like protein n=1 Tax=Cutaneotrichosporon oleaginosum TaxID=879819 RepID=A0A0J0XKW3_9TREE|nr:WD40 repeat-like protein [Cutaneotrichosporon oleaginosum]KLT41773.1 WD40 repeat-like protein [Cutaneotrichosporon oleaginosum]TXT12369.1 hypothetical protein COLE_02779 [Cutaneotrichosporon oleaginosum]
MEDDSEFLPGEDGADDYEDQDDEDEDDDDEDGDYTDDPDVNMDDSDEDQDMYVVDEFDDSDSDVQELALDPTEFMQLFSMFHSIDSDQARLALQRLVNRGMIGRLATQDVENRRKCRWWKPQVEPHPRGLALLRSGDFGPTGPWRTERTRPGERYAWRVSRDRALRRPHADPMIPNSHGTVVAEYASVPYVGQFCGPDHSVFYTATQNFKLYLYDMVAPKHEKWRRVRGGGTQVVTGGYPGVVSDEDTEEEGWLGGGRWSRHAEAASSLHTLKTVQGMEGRWTVTDADADRAGERMIYSSITPVVHLLKTDDHDSEHVALDFRVGRHDHFGIWSVRFSADGSEIVAGVSQGRIMVYDINAGRRTLNVLGHRDDVNAVCFADESSTNILVSGSDDGYVKIWDRRSLSSNIPSGVLSGATEGITYASPKGDGRYVVVNSKDQAARLYDLRKMRSWSEFSLEPDAVSIHGQRHFDYRNERYMKPKRLAHPRDCSVMTYRGHSVLRTLIRCHFSPDESTGQAYIYSGSADGLIHIWSLDGRIVQVLNRAESVPLRNARGGFNDPSAPAPQNASARPMGRGWVVRDVAWHAREPTLMSTCWEVEGRFRDRGSVAKHEWKGLGKGGLKLEDWVEKEQAERAG